MLRYSALFLLILPTLLTGEVVVQFDPSNPEIGPFPTDFLTVPDSTQLTGRRVNLPLPNCDAQPSFCTQLGLINQLDGFNVQPRLRVRFSGPVDTSTLRKGIFFVALDKLTSDEAPTTRRESPRPAQSSNRFFFPADRTGQPACPRWRHCPYRGSPKHFEQKLFLARPIVPEFVRFVQPLLYPTGPQAALHRQQRTDHRRTVRLQIVWHVRPSNGFQWA